MNELGPFSFWELLVLIVVVSALLGGGGAWFGHRRLEGRAGEGHNDVLVPIYATAAVIYAVLLAFIVIAVWEQYTAAKDNVAGEASALTTLDRETEAMPNPERGQLRVLLRDYTEAVVGPEWKLQESGGASPAARTAVTEIYRTLGRHPSTTATTPIDQEFVSQMSVVASDRNKRTLASQDRLPWVLWLGLVAGGLIVVMMSSVLYMENVWLHAALSSVVGVLVGVLLFSTVVLDRPFQGKLGIKPDAFDHSLSVFKQVDQTP